MPLLNMFGGKDKSKRRDEYDDEYDSKKRRNERGRRSEDDFDSKRERERSQSKYRTRRRSKSRDERRRSRSARRRSKSRSKSVVSSRGKSRMRSRSVVSTKSVDRERRKKAGTSTRRRRSRSADTLTSILRNGKNSERHKTQRGRDDALREEEASIRSKSRHRRRSKSISSARSKRDKSRSRPKGDSIDGESIMRSSSVRSKGMSRSSSRMSRRYRDDEEGERYQSRREEERNSGRSKSRMNSRRDDESTSGRSRRSKSRVARRDEDEKSTSKRSKSRRSRREEDEGRSTRSKSRMRQEDDECTSTRSKSRRSRRDGDENMSGRSATTKTDRMKRKDAESVSGMSTTSKGKQQSILRNSQSAYQPRGGVTKSGIETLGQSRENEEKKRPLVKPIIDESPRQSVKDLAQKLHNKVEQNQEHDRFNPQSVKRENAPWKSLNPNGLSNIRENPQQQQPQESKRTPPMNAPRVLNMNKVQRNSTNSSSSSIEARQKQVPQSQEQRFSISYTGQTAGNSSSISGRSNSSHGNSKWRCQACSNINLISQDECMNCGKQHVMQNNIVSQVPLFTGTRRKLVRSNSNTSISTISLSNSLGQSFSTSQNSSSRSRQIGSNQTSSLVVNVPTCPQQPVTISSNRITSPLSTQYQNHIKSSTIVVDAAKIPRQPWRCSCGNMNENTRSSCMNCGMSPSVSGMPNRMVGQNINMESASVHSNPSNQFTHAVYQTQQAPPISTTVPINAVHQTVYGNRPTYNSNESVVSRNTIVSVGGNGWVCSQCAASNLGAGNFCSSCGAKKMHMVTSGKGSVCDNNLGAPQDIRTEPIQEPSCRHLPKDVHEDSYRSNEGNQIEESMGSRETDHCLETRPQFSNANTRMNISHRGDEAINSDSRKKKGKGTRDPNIKKSALSSNVLTDIVAGNVQLKPPKPSNEENSPRNLSIFDQIKMGKNLKKATERELAPKPKRPISIMDEIKVGVDLKKVATSDPIDNPKMGFIHGVLAARRKLVGSSKNESIRSIESHDW